VQEIFLMSRIEAEEIKAVGKHLAAGISVRALAKKLKVTVPTALRRMKAYAAANELTLQSELVREGARGPASAKWSVKPAPAAAASRKGKSAPPKGEEAEDAALGLTPAIMNALESDERLALRVLAKAGTARTGELAARLGRSPDRMEGMMRMLRRKLHKLGSPMIDNETLPDGEALFRFTGKEE
jgi:hypothetical protein